MFSPTHFPHHKEVTSIPKIQGRWRWEYYKRHLVKCQDYNVYILVFNDYEECHDDFRDAVEKYEIRGFPTYVVIVKDGDKELHVGKFNSIKTDDMETKFKKEIGEAK